VARYVALVLAGFGMRNSCPHRFWYVVCKLCHATANLSMVGSLASSASSGSYDQIDLDFCRLDFEIISL
jgi:hypothetical protein